MMLKIAFIVGFLFLSFGQAGCYSQQTAVYNNDPGKIKEVNMPAEESDIYSYDFGVVKEGEVLKHEFILRNESQVPLIIKDINTSCGCTGSKAEKTNLLPQEETKIEVLFKTRGYHGKTQQYVYIHTDSLGNPLIKYVIKAEVIK